MEQPTAIHRLAGVPVGKWMKRRKRVTPPQRGARGDAGPPAEREARGPPCGAPAGAPGAARATAAVRGYALRRRVAARPSSAEPSSSAEPGSGTLFVGLNSACPRLTSEPPSASEKVKPSVMP